MGKLTTLVVVLALTAVSACSPPRPLSRERVPNVVGAESPYNFHAARQLLGQAAADERAGQTAQAQAGYRQAALRWPGMTKAWRGLARTADEPQEQVAARFLAARTELVGSNDIVAQRQIASALRAYLDEQRALDGANPMTLEYGTQLVGFYDDLYETRGVYEQPRPFGNVQPNEVPTAIITGVGAGIYLGVVLTGD